MGTSSSLSSPETDSAYLYSYGKVKEDSGPLDHNNYNQVLGFIEDLNISSDGIIIKTNAAYPNKYYWLDETNSFISYDSIITGNTAKAYRYLSLKM